MFQKPTFGTTTSGFGTFGNATPSTSSPFGGFKATTGTGAFGAAPAFGSTTPAQPAGGSFFGASNTSTGLFGSTTPASTAPAFGATGSGFGFGATNTGGGGMFGSANTSTGLFGNNQTPNTSAFGAKPAGFGFGSTTTTGTTGTGLFGATTNTTGLFGQQNTSLGGGGLFGNTTGAFGQQQQQAGTAHVKYNPVVGTDVIVKSGSSQNINIKHHCITCMKEYEGKSFEELRLEDYLAGRKGAANTGMFGASKPLFGGNTFGQPATTSAPSVFGGSSLGTTGFGQTNTFSFGSNTPNTSTTSNLFGANKPAFGATPSTGTNLFGATTTQAPAFGTNTSTFGFASNTQNQSTGLFGAKPATTGFGATSTAGGFGGFGTGGGLFGAKPQQSAAPSFPGTTPAFGTGSTGFTSTSGSLFGNNALKPATQPTFGFGATQPTTGLGTGLGGGLGTSTFQPKPAGTGFPSLSTSGSSLFGGTQTAPTLNFNTGNTTLGGGLGGGLNFGNTSTLGGSTLGGGLGGFGAANTSAMANTSIGGSAAGNVHEQILSLAARPYGDSPLFKDLLPDTAPAEETPRATNPTAVRAALEADVYKLAPPTAPPRLQPHSRTHDRKSLFDGLEEADASLEDKLSLKPSRKRLVLRPPVNRNSDGNEEAQHHDGDNNNHRSLDDAPVSRSNAESQNNNGSIDNAREPLTDSNVERRRSDYNENLRGVNTDLEDSSERHGSWLGSSKLPWNDSKEKPIDDAPTPRMYPDLVNELASHNSERRASWLTTKPLRKKSQLPEPHDMHDSVHELRADLRNSHDKENVDHLSVSEDENVSPREAPPHPTGVKLTRPGYYTIPSLDDMISYIRPDGRCVVPNLIIGRKNYGNVFYDCEIDVTGLDLDSLVHFLNKEVIIYPEDADKPPVGEGLNRRAVITLDRIWPRDKTEKRPVTDPNRLILMDYEGKLRRVCDKHDTKFIEYRPQTGSWVFRVEHFSKYGLTDSDEEDDITPEVLKRQLVSQSLQKNAAPAVAAQKPIVPIQSAGLGGGISPEDSLFAMQQSSLNLLNGTGRVFEMETEDNTEVQSMYSDSHRAYGVKSPTSELARLENRHSHNVQLMKASLYADTEMEDDESVSTGDQLVPQPISKLTVSRPPSSLAIIHHIEEDEVLAPTITDEVQMKPLIVQPHTVVLQYHRKIPPFKYTIAGKLGASCLADMAVCRARHARVGFGPRNTLAYVTTHENMAAVPTTADLSKLNAYVTGRGENDWSESVVTRLAIGHSTGENNIQDYLSGHLEALLDFSTTDGDVTEGVCPRLKVRESPRDRRELLERHLKEAVKGNRRNTSFGVSSNFCHEVWQLCEALWAADLENDGVPGNDEQSIVNRHKALLEWLTLAVADMTDAELAKPTAGEAEDESDGHSARIWTLLLGGRLLEACKVAREAGDLNMAVLLSQAPFDSAVRSLLARQLSVWRECGAADLIARSRWLTLALLAGKCEPNAFAHHHWLRTLHAVARYLCPQVPTLERIITKYEGFFSKPSDDDSEVDGELQDLSLVQEDGGLLEYPLPPYECEYDVNAEYNGNKRRVLDLRYELIRARALNTRPKLQPASYTPDPFDYSLCFLLGTWFGNPSVESIIGIAEQLEAAGAWHLAVQALAYHPEDRARCHLIRNVLSRHAPSEAKTSDEKSRLDLLKRLKVPEEWIRLAQAHRAKYEHQPRLEALHLCAAKQWSAAHKVFVDELLSTTVLANDLESIAPLLEQMNEAAQRDEIHGWETGGLALYNYHIVCKEIQALMSSLHSEEADSAEDVRSRACEKLEALRPRVAAAFRSLANLRTRSPLESAARAELGSRLLQAAGAGSEVGACSAPSVKGLAGLLAALKLPPDCIAATADKLTLELADQASEYYAESIASSPSVLRRTVDEV